MAVERYDWKTRCQEMAAAYSTVALKRTSRHRRGSSSGSQQIIDTSDSSVGLSGLQSNNGGEVGVSLRAVSIVAIVSMCVGIAISRTMMRS